MKLAETGFCNQGKFFSDWVLGVQGKWLLAGGPIKYGVLLSCVENAFPLKMVIQGNGSTGCSECELFAFGARFGMLLNISDKQI